MWKLPIKDILGFESFSALKAPLINPLLMWCFACGARGSGLRICRRWVLQQLLNCSQRGITLSGNRNLTLFRTNCLKSFSSWNWCNDWLISYFYIEDPPSFRIYLSPRRIGERNVMFFKLYLTEFPKHRTCYPPDWLEESGTGGFECWTLDYNSRLSEKLYF